ncbi:Asp-tRNA(Asn)/Glu-tRNA(Gln) amidotransferase subunit GatB [Candidatus Magnetominusculus dajiuhuensis]|uniref:Asp-tRNA(Asn)/Glu-tRNA(Gln) amidotransferase subunit GatB n=1 Tax=Candidatus Magnetominusculus dajiuhuensis TaxID=3137712 RepID=UPI003B432547
MKIVNDYETVIGLEIHAQMKTQSKMFCGCPTRFGEEPNTQTCPVCIGMPGVLPVINKLALEFTIKTGVALGCKISPFSRFARKNYFYPDLPKGYQVSQYELPICEGGFVMLNVDDDEGQRRINLTRIHMEEDAGKNIHEGAGSFSYVDLNRAGVPLMEIVSEPDIKTPKEAAAYVRKIRTILRYLDVCDGNMDEGSLRCDANVSLRPQGVKELGVKTEIKNINSFKFIEKALEYEIQRQTRVLNEGGRIIQETRLWNTTTGTTESMRSKEEAHDYRYFPEPDLVPLMVDEGWIAQIRKEIPELPDEKVRRYIEDYKLPAYDADLLAAERHTAAWFEQTVGLGANPKDVSNWMMGEMMRLLNEKGLAIEASPLRPEHLHGLIQLINNGTINLKTAKIVFEDMFNTGKSAEEVVKEKGLVQISDVGELEKTVAAVIAENPNETARYKAGETKLTGFFVGEVMKKTKGKANPKAVNEILKRLLL